MGKYDLSALYGRDNALAKEAGSNGGNIDSFAAANALRQQAALINQGQMAVLSGYSQKLEHARKLLSDMGVNIGRTAEEDEAERNGDVKRKTEIASVTGQTPDEWTASLNPYMNEDGTLKERYKNLDFAAIMQNAKESGNDEAYKNAALARFYKIMGDYESFGKYDDGNYTVPGRQITEDARQFNEQIAQADRALGAEKEINSENNRNKLDVIRLEGEYKNTKKPKITAEQASKAIKNGDITGDVIDAYNYYFGTSYTVENPPGKAGTGGGGAPLSDKDVRAWVNYLNSDISKRYGKDKRALAERGENKYARADAEAAYIVNKVYDASELTKEQKNYLLYDKFGITEEEVAAALNERRGKNTK